MKDKNKCHVYYHIYNESNICWHSIGRGYWACRIMDTYNDIWINYDGVIHSVFLSNPDYFKLHNVRRFIG